MLKKLPLSLQHFETLRLEDRLYVDKTELVYKLTHLDANCVFLSRPRRFGKSLLVNTLKAYFQGKRELFKGLAIESLEHDWAAFPVLHFDFSGVKDVTRESLESNIDRQLAAYEEVYGRDPADSKVNDRFKTLVIRARKQAGKKVVLLVDEYDAPLLESIHNEDLLPEIRTVMRNFYSPIKLCSEHIHFAFITGITKFSQLSIFSELNNILNVSMLEDFAALCGITEKEMEAELSGHIDALAMKLEITHDSAVKKLKEMYDGYHFTLPSPDIYNPYSLLLALSTRKIDSYWFESGTPTYLIQMLNKFKVIPQEIGGRKCRATAFDAPTNSLTDITPLLYQSGYLTIKACSKTGTYTLDYPNKEVRLGMAESLLVNYVVRPSDVSGLAGEMGDLILDGDFDGALKLMQRVLSSLPYCENANSEGHYQSLLSLLFTLIGFVSIQTEVRTPTGRVDVVIRTPDELYLLELKLGGRAREALAQINEKGYAEKFALEGKRIFKVGIAFDVEKRTIGEWVIE